MFHPHWRDQALAALAQPFDLIVLGGGITGCGVFLDASQRGLRVLLVETHDIASGTSSRSSKLVHGGLRYLKQMQLKVTRQSCRERDRQLNLNPHLVSPLPWIYPAYQGDRPAGWQVEWGLKLYDRFTEWPDKHRQLTLQELKRMAPDLPREKLERALTYVDGRVDDARLTLAVAATGLAHGGSILTRTTMEAGLLDARGRLKGLRLRDQESGVVYRAEAELIVNATGTWVDRVRHRLGLEGTTVRPSRGSHLLFAHRTLPISAAVTLPSPDDGRPVFFIPHPEGVLVGTTDLFHRGSLDDPRPTRQEVDYLLRASRATFPTRQLSDDDIVGCFAGLRPVLQNHAESPSAATREEAIWHENGLVSVAGGKLTTWRSTAEEAVDVCLTHLTSRRAKRAAPCSTAGTPLLGRAPLDLAQRLCHTFEVDETVATAMARRLGSLAWTACELADDKAELRPLVDGSDLSTVEVRAHVRYGGVLHLSDLLLRRVRLGMWNPEQAEDLLVHLRRPLRRVAGWTRRRWDDELEAYGQSAEAWSRHGISATEANKPSGATESSDEPSKVLAEGKP